MCGRLLDDYIKQHTVNSIMTSDQVYKIIAGQSIPYLKTYPATERIKGILDEHPQYLDTIKRLVQVPGIPQAVAEAEGILEFCEVFISEGLLDNVSIFDITWYSFRSELHRSLALYHLSVKTQRHIQQQFPVFYRKLNVLKMLSTAVDYMNVKALSIFQKDAPSDWPYPSNNRKVPFENAYHCELYCIISSWIRTSCGLELMTALSLPPPINEDRGRDWICDLCIMANQITCLIESH